LKEREPEKLAIFSFPGSVAPTFNKYTILGCDFGKTPVFNWLKTNGSKLFRNGDHRVLRAIASNACGIRNAAPNFAKSGKTPTDWRNSSLTGKRERRTGKIFVAILCSLVC
jgi:hypothetical protein